VAPVLPKAAPAALTNDVTATPVAATAAPSVASLIVSLPNWSLDRLAELGSLLTSNCLLS